MPLLPWGGVGMRDKPQPGQPEPSKNSGARAGGRRLQRRGGLRILTRTRVSGPPARRRAPSAWSQVHFEPESDRAEARQSMLPSR